MKVIAAPRLLSQFEGEEPPLISSEQDVLIEMVFKKRGHESVQDKMRFIHSKIREKGFRLKNIREIYCRVDVPLSYTLGDHEEVEAHFGLGMKADVYYNVSIHRDAVPEQWTVSVAFRYSRELYQQEVVPKKVHMLMEKRNDSQILYHLFGDEKYKRRAERIFRCLSAMEAQAAKNHGKGAVSNGFAFN